MSYPCPCCGYLVFSAGPGSGQVCDVCAWEDDVVQLRWPEWVDGANRPSLLTAQRTAAATGVSDVRYHGVQADPHPGLKRDRGWRPLDPNRDRYETVPDRRAPWPPDTTALYWWRSGYWRR